MMNKRLVGNDLVRIGVWDIFLIYLVPFSSFVDILEVNTRNMRVI